MRRVADGTAGPTAQRIGATRRARPVANLAAVVFRPDRLRGADALPGEIDYRLARQSILSEFRKGRLARHEVCDAHPELVRAARNVGQASHRECPICEQDDLVLVSYVFGGRLPSHGRCVSTRAEMAKLAGREEDLACYVVEVCPSCSWNHLTRSFLLSGPRPGSPLSVATAPRASH